MEYPIRRRESEDEVNEIVAKTLNEDLQEDSDCEDMNNCPGNCMEDNPVTKICECIHIAANSSRLCLRVLEAMRWLQRDGDFLTATIDDIVNYIEMNYRDVGDIYSQVRTVLNQARSQGFVMEFLENEYLLIGPLADSMNCTVDSNLKSNCASTSEIIDKKCEQLGRHSCECGDGNQPEDTTSGECSICNPLENLKHCACSTMQEDKNYISKKQFALNSNEANRSRKYGNANRRNQNRSIQLGLSGSRGRRDVLADVEENGGFETTSRMPRSRKRDRELKKWIKHCREQCERRKPY